MYSLIQIPFTPLHKMQFTPLEIAVGGNEPVYEVKALIDADPEFIHSKRGKEMMALRIACEEKVSAIIVKALIDAYKGTLKDNEFPGTTPLHSACVPSEIWYEYDDNAHLHNPLLAIPYLLEACPRMASYRNKNGFTPLDIAVGNNLPWDYMKIIVDTAPETITQVNKHGWSPLSKVKAVSAKYPALIPVEAVEYMRNKIVMA